MNQAVCLGSTWSHFAQGDLQKGNFQRQEWSFRSPDHCEPVMISDFALWFQDTGSTVDSENGSG